MSQDLQRQAPAPVAFRQHVENIAGSMLDDLLGSEAGQKAAKRCGIAFATAARTARNPDALFSCAPASVASCVAMSAMTDLHPGGAHADVWLIPRGNELTWMISHRGIIKMSRKAGFTVRAIPVNISDPVFKVSGGDVVEHESDPDAWPKGLKDLRGVYVVIKDHRSGEELGRPWMPLAAIQERREKTQTGPVWNKWPVEMAMKTAIKWAAARGYIPLEMEAKVALEADTRAELPPVEPVVVDMGPQADDVASRMGLIEDSDGDVVDVEEAADGNRRADLVAEIISMEASLDTETLMKVRGNASVGVTTKPSDGRLKEDTILLWHELLTEEHGES